MEEKDGLDKFKEKLEFEGKLEDKPPKAPFFIFRKKNKVIDEKTPVEIVSGLSKNITDLTKQINQMAQIVFRSELAKSKEITEDIPYPELTKMPFNQRIGSIFLIPKFSLAVPKGKEQETLEILEKLGLPVESTIINRENLRVKEPKDVN